MLDNSTESPVDRSIGMASLGSQHLDDPGVATHMERRLLASTDPDSLRQRHPTASQSAGVCGDNGGHDIDENMIADMADDNYPHEDENREI